jgi:hypothetical protein
MNITEQNQYQIIFQAKVLESDDPASLGRIRATLINNEDQSSINKGTQWDEKKDKWTTKDPFIVLPLLPFYYSQVPKKDELVNIIFQNKMYDTQNKFYIQGPFSSPLSTGFEDFQGAQANLTAGARTKQKPDLKNQDGSYKPGTEGLFPKPQDVALVGRGISDVVIKEKELLLRSGKMIPAQGNNIPKINDNRSFLQLSYFDSNKKSAGVQTESKIEEKPAFIKKIVIWNISNPENTQSALNGSVGLYTMKELEENNTQKFTYDSIDKLSIGTNYSGPIEQIIFYNQSVDGIRNIVNDFILSVYNGTVEFKDYPVSASTNFQNCLPFAVAPSKLTKMAYQQALNKLQNPEGTPPSNIFAPGVMNTILIAAPLTIVKNIEFLMNEIRIDFTKKGFFVISSKDQGVPQYDSPTQPKTESFEKFEIDSTPTTYAIMGGQKIYLMSQDSKSNKGVLSFNDTIYGIKQESFVGPEGFENKTFSTVRGEELISLLEKIVSYLSSHVHNPVSPPDPIGAGNGQTISEIQQLLQNAAETILNKNIRIN